MTERTSPKLTLRARGPLACFTRPELKAERVTYPVMTPSAARGLLEAVVWKPAIRWRVHRIAVLQPIRFISFRRNEVNSKAPAPAKKLVEEGGQPPTLYADDDRAQRNTVALREVDYLIEASFAMTERAGPADNVAKFVDIFERRVAKGQHFHQPYLGCREFAADVLPAEGAPAPIGETGLDPAVGFLHRDRPGRPSLALDLMEELRPYLADRLALSLVNKRQVQPRGFTRDKAGGVWMDDDTRKTVLTAYQKRKDDEVVHPFLGEKTTVGMLVHLQALLLARHLRGDLDGYPPFVAKG